MDTYTVALGGFPCHECPIPASREVYDPGLFCTSQKHLQLRFPSSTVSVSFQAEIYLRNLFAASESATVVAADGSSLFGEGTGQGTPTETPGIVSIVETYTVIGGTGQFAGAAGNFTVERVINRAIFAYTGTILGTIVIP